jgi:superfamily II RNA helicase
MTTTTPALSASAGDPPLLRLLPPREATNADTILNAFLDYASEAGLELYPAQEEAVLEIMAGKNVILNTPTGSGKSLVATAMHFKALAEDRVSFYTCPIKALVSEKFFALCRDFGPENVGMMTGDATVNREAPIICCTAEVLSNMALREGAALPVDYVIMDEFHYYADRDRGVAWQIPLLTLSNATFLLMSATLGSTDYFETALNDLTQRETAVVRSAHRPVPLDFEYRDVPLHETVLDLVSANKAPIYVVNFTQRAAAEEAQNLMSTDFCTKEEKRAIGLALAGFRFDSPYGKEIEKFLRHGVGLHHAGLLPKYRLLVEKLAQKGLLKLICGTDTLGVGVNIPIRTVLFTKLFKYDGERLGLLSVRDFQQIAGRAGRKGFDTQGTVVVQAPEHAIENLRLERKAVGDPAKMKKIVRKKPPEKGYVHWDKAAFERLSTGQPEALRSRFQVSHSMLLNVLGRPGEGCRAMKRLLRENHEPKPQKRVHQRTALQLFRSLARGGIIELVPRSEGGGVRVNVDLQQDFSLNQSLSLYLVETLDRLDPDSPELALDVLSLVEAILENPEVILMKQLDRLKTNLMAELKAKGVEYDERIAELEKLEYPKPNREFIYDTFNDFARHHPWVGQENIRPKSIAREMFESYLSFSGYIKEYGLQRSEGLLLRYLSDVYKVLVQTVPERAKTELVDEITAFFGSIVRETDTSLLEEWERLRNPAFAPAAKVDTPTLLSRPEDVTADKRAFTAEVRNEIFRLLRALGTRDYEAATQLVTGPGGFAWAAADIERMLAPYFEEYGEIRLDQKARGANNTLFSEPKPRVWRVAQTIVDPEEHNDWAIELDVDLDASREKGAPVLELRQIGR